MPLYEFECGRCGARFEELVDAGTEETACGACGTEGARRRYSAPAAPLRIVKSAAGTRKQARRNAELRSRAKSEFKGARRRARDPSAGGS